MNMLPAKSVKRKLSKTAEYLVDSSYSVPGIGTLVGGILNKGTIKLNDKLYIGPNGSGSFRETSVKGIQRKRVDVLEAKQGEVVTLALRKVNRDIIRKGMILVSNPSDGKANWHFKAKVQIVIHSTTIRNGYNCVIHSTNIRQSAKIVSMNKTMLRTGDIAKVNFRWLKYPECLKVGAKIIFREGRTKGIGKVIEVY